MLYVAIKQWDAQFAFITTTVTVDFEYRLVSKDGTDIWKEEKKMQYQPQNNSGGGLLGMVINAAVARAAPNYMPLTQQANQQVFFLGPNPLPKGPNRQTGPEK